MLEFELARTLDDIAEDIRGYIREAQEAVISSTIKIGMALCEAKEQVQVGQWGKWLKDNFNYSERTAQNAMAIYNEYGKKGIPEGLKNASVTNALALLGQPEDVKHELLDSGAAESMSSREFQAEIARLKKEKEEMQQNLFALMDEKEKRKAGEDELEKIRKEYDQEVSRLRIRLSEVTVSESNAREAAMKASERAAQMDEAHAEDERARRGLMAKISQLEGELDRAKKGPMEPAVVERVPEEIEKELRELRARVNAQRTNEGSSTVLFRDAYGRLIETFKRCSELTAEVARFEGESQAMRLRTALAKAARQMANQLEQ